MYTDVFLLFVDVSDLEPNVSMGQRVGRITEDTIKTGKGLFVFALLFVDDTEAEKNFICLVKILRIYGN